MFPVMAEDLVTELYIAEKKNSRGKKSVFDANFLFKF